jgi:3-oxoadipate enol-lactonase
MTEKGNGSPPNLLYFIERGSGKPLLLIHGLLVTGEMFRDIMEPLAENHRVIVPDLRGSGGSRNLPPPYTVKQQASDLAQLLNHLKIKSVDVLGYSQGGPVAQQLAIDYPTMVHRLILSNTYAHNMGTTSETIEGSLIPLLIRIIGLQRFVKLARIAMDKETRERTEWLRKIMSEQDQRLMIIAWKEAMAFDSRCELGRIKCPTLIIAGEKDQAVPMYHAEMLHEGIRGSKLVVIEGADHDLIWAHPDKWLKTFEEFIQGTNSS